MSDNSCFENEKNKTTEISFFMEVVKMFKKDEQVPNLKSRNTCPNGAFSHFGNKITFSLFGVFHVLPLVFVYNANISIN